MSVDSTDTYVEYAGNGATLSFNIAFKFLRNADITVVLVNDSTGAETPQTVGVEYSMVGVSDPGTGILFVDPPPTGYTVRIDRNTPKTQPTNLTVSGTYQTSVIQSILDRIILIQQEIYEEVRTNTAALVAAGALSIPDSGTGLSATYYLKTGTGATFNTPAWATKLKIKMIGGGGSGGCSSGAGAGNDGGDTIFNGIEAAGGSGGLENSNTGGAGGTGGAGSANLRIAGNSGQGKANLTYASGGAGGAGALGGGTTTPTEGTTISPIANSGSGGHGVCNYGAVFSGGGAGEYVELIIEESIAASYTYTIGAGGAGVYDGSYDIGSGDGASGLIIVEALG